MKYLLVLAFSLKISLAFNQERGNIREITETVKPEMTLLIRHLYNSLEGKFEKPRYVVFEKAYIGFLNLKAQKLLTNTDLLSVIDFTVESKEQRFWIIDLNNKIILLHSLVAHGKNSGLFSAETFSNKPQSYQSSLGFYVTGGTYHGKHGLSLYLHGKEDGINHKALERAIVLHSADYVTKDFVRKNGRAGRSHGCPAIPPRHLEKVVKWIKDGSCLFIYFPKPGYWAKTKLQNQEIAMKELEKALQGS